MNDWDTCIEESMVRAISTDTHRAKSLMQTAQERIEVINQISERNCNFVFEDYYSSIMELIQAMCFLEGFNVLNHKCIGFYLRDKLGKSELYIIFDDLRYKRNSLTYYGTKTDFQTAKKAIADSKKLFAQLLHIIQKTHKYT